MIKADCKIKTNQRGVILIASLMLLMLLSIMTALSYEMAFRKVQLYQDSHARQAEFKALTSNSQSAFLGSQFFDCPQSQGRHGLYQVSRSLCRLVSQFEPQDLKAPNIEGMQGNFPLFNNRVIFNSLTPCPVAHTSRPALTSLGTPISLGSAVSQATCPLTAQSHQTVAGNLILNASQTKFLSAPGILVARGYIDVAGQLDLSGPTIIIAAGDLHLHRLHSNSALTLISITGQVIVDKIQGVPQLKLIAKQGIIAPALWSTSDNGLWPPIQSSLLLGIK
jgi:hypothetical protein